MPLLNAFNKHCQLTPERTAFCEGERRLSFGQTYQQADRLGAFITTKAGPAPRVAIALDRGIDAAIAILAIVGVGGCYIPLDIKNPPERLAFIVNDAQPHCVIGAGPCPNWLNTPELWLDITQTTPSPSRTWPLSVDSEALAAILYTSGSTGAPKGVALSRRALHNFAAWATETFAVSTDDRIASLAPFYFDLSVFDLFGGLSSGAAIHFVPSGLTLTPSRLSAWLQEQRISVFYTVPSLLGFLALKGNLADTTLADLKTVLFAGEVFATPLLQKLCELLPDTDFYNLYGPTETNVCCYWPVQRERLRAEHPIPIGLPACGAQLRIDDDSGELRVRSANNLSGYWRQGRLTGALDQDNTYRTGDKVSLNAYGEYCYHGRLDRMLKCSGYRVEPAEIEAVLLQCPEVEACAVVGIKDATSGQRPAAALTMRSDAKLQPLIARIRQALPVYMHPCKYLVLEALPYLANGKIDYQALQNQLE